MERTTRRTHERKSPISIKTSVLNKLLREYDSKVRELEASRKLATGYWRKPKSSISTDNTRMNTSINSNCSDLHMGHKSISKRTFKKSRPVVLMDGNFLDLKFQTPKNKDEEFRSFNKMNATTENVHDPEILLNFESQDTPKTEQKYKLKIESLKKKVLKLEQDLFESQKSMKDLKKNQEVELEKLVEENRSLRENEKEIQDLKEKNIKLEEKVLKIKLESDESWEKVKRKYKDKLNLKLQEKKTRNFSKYKSKIYQLKLLLSADEESELKSLKFNEKLLEARIRDEITVKIRQEAECTENINEKVAKKQFENLKSEYERKMKETEEEMKILKKEKESLINKLEWMEHEKVESTPSSPIAIAPIRADKTYCDRCKAAVQVSDQIENKIMRLKSLF